MRPVHYLVFEFSDADDGQTVVTTIEALASTPEPQHAAVMAEVQQVLDWARREFASSHGPIDDGNDWDHDLQVHVEAGGWHSVALAISASAAFAREFAARFTGTDDH